MTAMLASGQYEWKSLGAVYQGNSAKAFPVAVAFHITLIGIMYAVGPVDGPHQPPGIICVLPAPPRLEISQPPAPRMTGGGGLRSAAMGIPVPVPIIDDIEEQIKPPAGSGSSENDVLEGSGNGLDGLSEGEEKDGFPGGAIDLTKDWTGSLDKFPIPIREIKPEYPPLALLMGIEGTVTVKILIDKNGKPEKAEISKGANELLNDAAMHAALKWLFVPAVMNNNTVAVWVAVPFRFRVADK